MTMTPRFDTLHACQRFHLVNPKTGEVFGADEE